MGATPGRGGRKTRGPRRALGVRVPIPLADDVLRAADAAGLTITDYVANMLAAAHGHPPVAVATPVDQQRLPIGA